MALYDRAALEARVINWNCAPSHSPHAAPPGAGALRLLPTASARARIFVEVEEPTEISVALAMRASELGSGAVFKLVHNLD